MDPTKLERINKAISAEHAKQRHCAIDAVRTAFDLLNTSDSECFWVKQAAQTLETAFNLIDASATLVDMYNDQFEKEADL